jgi:DNA replication protein DnaC
MKQEADNTTQWSTNGEQENPFTARLRAKIRVATPEEVATDEAEKHRQEALLLKSKADKFGVPQMASLRRVALSEDYQKTAALKAFMDALNTREAAACEYGTEPMVLIVSGPAGTGKSCAMARAVVRHKRLARWIDAALIGATPRNGFSASEEIWADWLSVDLLAIDDLGCESGDPAAVNSLLAQRHNRGLATIATTNSKKADFLDHYFDSRLSDRVIRGQTQWWVSVTGESLRGGK